MSLHHSAEQALEILARELFVAATPDLPAGDARTDWYLTLTDGLRDGWRRKAGQIMDGLAESDLTVTWT